MNTIALFGNPNTGKTSLFNKLTRTYAETGNWSGVTVSMKSGLLRNKSGMLVDLPGLYSLLPFSLDEGVAARYLLEQPPSSLINIVDAAQLERNLYLTVQLLEYGAPLVLGLNMMDVARSSGITVSPEKLSSELGVPVIPMSARTGAGSKEVLAAVHEKSVSTSHEPLHLNYGPEVEQTIDRIMAILPDIFGVESRWLALQLLERNPVVWAEITDPNLYAGITQIITECQAALMQADPTSSSSPEAHLRNVRVNWIAHVCQQVMVRSTEQRKTWTERADMILTHRIFGLPLFLLFMFLTFKVTFDWLGNPLSDVLDGWIAGGVSDTVTALLESLGASSFTQALIVDGIIAGVGGVLVFTPQIVLLFLIISIVEDSGYMARVTLLMDRLMESVGLNGKAFIPFIIGFGCNVPAIMAARSIEQPKERLLTTLLVPFMSCSARLPVYALFAGVFFREHQASVVMLMYVLGIVLALLLSKTFSALPFVSKEPSLFVVELPPYRMPQALTLFRITWEKVKGFLRKAGTIILAGSVIIWFLSNMGLHGFGSEMDDSLLAMLGGWLAPLLTPLGFGTWQAGASLVTGFMAKEVVVSTMNIIYHAPDMSGLETSIHAVFTPLSAFSFMAFILLYIPCLATVGVIHKETASLRWTMISMLYPLVIAYVISILIYQGGHLLGLS